MADKAVPMSDLSPLDVLRAKCAEPLPHPDAESLRVACQAVADFVVADFTTLSQRGTGHIATRSEMERLLREPPPEQGADFAKVLDEYFAKIAPNATRSNHPRFLAFVPGAPSFYSVLGDWLCAGTNVFAGVWKEAAAAAQVEILVLDWFKTFLGYPYEAMGLLTSGGSEANLTALVVARERLPFDDRLFAVLYTSEHRHWSLDRAVKIIGMHPDQIRALPADEDGRLRVDLLKDAIAHDRLNGRIPWAVVANAGATNTGSVDPLAELADICAAENLWLHADAAYGWPMVLTEDGRRAMAGIDRADSITLDPHKWFGQTFDAGCLMVRRGDALPETFAMRPEYMQDVTPENAEVNFADHGIALTRRFRALKIWLSLKCLGVDWFRHLVQQNCDLAELSQRLLEQAGTFEIMSRHQLSIVCFRYVPPGGNWSEADLDALNLRINDELRRTGQAFLSTTKIRGRVAQRMCYVNWRSTAADVEKIVAWLAEIGARLSRPGRAS
jgi:aromatic-L-amino-acid decarboxylase